MPIPATVPRDLPILVVDDFATMRRIVRNSLRQLGFTNVVEAADGNEALEKLKESEFQLIITEWNIPTIDGSDLLKAVRADDKHRDTPLLASTEKRDGVATYVIKPLTTAILEAKMASLLEVK
jgi:two-component system chemotaxis response regulator CheY